MRAPIALSAILFGGTAADARPMVWPETYSARVEALALIEALNARLLEGPSATVVLEKWCADHRMAPDPRISALVARDISKEATAEQRKRLGVGSDEPICYRRVRLVCGEHVLSEADNWYVPARLTSEMNRLLDGSDIPFGRVVQSLDPGRRSIAVRSFWSPLPEGWETERALPLPPELFEHRALLLDRSGAPLAEVVETYSSEILAFPLRP
jgi:chorismate-pyruvate lyase